MRKYETKFKLKVVESFLAGDGGAKLLARRWSVPEEKIRTWVSHYRLHGVAGLQPKRGAYTRARTGRNWPTWVPSRSPRRSRTRERRAICSGDGPT
ncbi:helix-turn-helix domain-containing protein [Variovorax sp. OK605]|uniref:helix-turn-helix domain-containing protein n=1 Tax=Variovorax sp. OK605 TaxID=1855317 RepID=UPI001160AAD5